MAGEFAGNTKKFSFLQNSLSSYPPARAKSLLFLLSIAWLFFLAPKARAQTFGCTPSLANDIVCENSKPGTPESVWAIPSQMAGDAADPSIQGFATDISVNHGATVFFKIKTDAAAYHLDIYRLGYYQGNGARLIATVLPSVPLPQSQPACLTDPATLLYDCGNWSVSASWDVPANATSGIYFARLQREDTGGANYIVFIVRADEKHSDVLYQTSDETWQAYNPYGGHSLYGADGPAGWDITQRAYKVSYNRPFNTALLSRPSWLFSAEYPMVRWLERNGYDVSYSTHVDGARSPALILNHKLYMSAGHDEYWSGDLRNAVAAARDAGVHLAFFSGNEVFWKTRWEPSMDGSATPYRTLVCYKETIADAQIDPLAPSTWTGTWRDPRFSPPADGGRPENSLTGTLFAVNGPAADNDGLQIQVPAEDGKMRFWRNTSVANLAPGQVASLGRGTLGYEWDIDADNGSRPPGLFHLSSTPQTLTSSLLLDYGKTYGAGDAVHHMTLYRASSGALVFSAGSVQWSWGLDSDHDNPFQGDFDSPPANPDMQQAAVNLLADMGIQPATLQPGLLAASKSTDITPPSSQITSPLSGAVFSQNSTVTITGTAADSGGGVVAGVEVSFDNGRTWHPANGRASWTYTFTATQLGATTFLSRAVDDSGNLESPSAGVSATIAGPYSLSGTISPAAAGSGATISVTGPFSVSATADSSSNFTVIGLDNGDFTVTPSKPGYQFNPASVLVTVNGSSLSGLNFTATPLSSPAHSITGSVTPLPLGAGVLITLTGAATATTETDSNGNFFFTDLPDGSYTLSPSKNMVLFSPPQLSVTIAGADSAASFTAASTRQTIFTTQTPRKLGNTDGPATNYELGTAFQSDIPGRITAIRFWKDANETGTHIGTIWSASGQVLSWVVFAGETASGWQEQPLPDPVSIDANTTYVVSVNTGNTYYVATNFELFHPVVNQDLSSAAGNNGLFGPVGSLPTNSYKYTNYYRDVVFVSSAVSVLQSLTLNSNAVLGGNSVTATVTLSNPAPSGGATVTLTSNSPSALVPASVTVPAGATSATFTVNTSPVSQATPVLISGIYHELHMAILVVNQPAVSGLTLNPNSVTGGTPVTATVALTGSAPAGGAAISLSSDNPAATVPASVTVPAGAVSAVFAIQTSPVSGAASAVISASYNGTQFAPLAINPPALSSLVLSPSTVVGGNPSTGIVTLTGPAPAGGVAVAIASDSPAAIVPPTVTVAEGSLAASFAIGTYPATSPALAHLSATYSGTQSATLQIQIASIASISLDSTSIPGGNSSAGTIALTGPAPAGGALVTLSAPTPVVSGIVGVFAPSGLPQPNVLDWSAVGPAYSPVDSGAAIAIPGQPGVTAAISTATGLPMAILTNCAFGGDCSWYGNFADGASVLWVNGTYFSETGWWQPNAPLTIRFSSPQRGLGFQIMGDEFGAFTASLCAYNAADTLLGCVPFTGTGNGAADNSARFAGLYDEAPEITRVTVDGGGLLYPHDFAISSLYVTSAPRQLVPASVLVPAGASSANFAVSTGPVSAVTNVSITANYNGSQSAALTINPPALASIQLSSSEVIGGASLTATAVLTGQAPQGGVTVALSADQPVVGGIQTVSDPAALSKDGNLVWTDFGAPFASIDSGTSLPVNGISGLQMKIETRNGLSPMVLTACPAPADCGWSGNFIPNAPLLWVGGSYASDGSWKGNGPLTLTFSTPVRGVGFNVMADEAGPFSGTICAYDSSGMPLGCSPFAGIGAPFAGGTNGFAPLAGIYDDVPEIAKVVVDAGGALYAHDFAIGQVVVSQNRRTVPASVTIQPGASSANFTVNTNDVDAPASATITGTYGQTRQATVIIQP